MSNPTGLPADRVVAVIGSDRLSGFEVLVRLTALGPGDVEAGPATPAAPPEPLLYPTLHRLEALGRLRATWSTDGSGRRRRLYRARTGARG